MQVDRDDLLHAVLDVLRSEEIGFTFSLDGHLSHVFQQDRGDGLGRAVTFTTV